MWRAPRPRVSRWSEADGGAVLHERGGAQIRSKIAVPSPGQGPRVRNADRRGDRARRIRQKTAVFQLDVPATSLRPGAYTWQVKVVDDASGRFAFPRLQLYVPLTRSCRFLLRVLCRPARIRA